MFHILYTAVFLYLPTVVHINHKTILYYFLTLKWAEMFDLIILYSLYFYLAYIAVKFSVCLIGICSQYFSLLEAVFSMLNMRINRLHFFGYFHKRSRPSANYSYFSHVVTSRISKICKYKTCI